MPAAVTIKPRIIEGLRREALALSSEVAVTFALPPRSGLALTDEGRAAMAQEGLRAATTLIAALGWLDAHCAFFRKEIDRAGLAHRARLSPLTATALDPRRSGLDPDAQRLCEATKQFHERLARLDRSWRLSAPAASAASAALKRLRDRVQEAPAS